jgi:hypothetical protein
MMEQARLQEPQVPKMAAAVATLADRGPAQAPEPVDKKVHANEFLERHQTFHFLEYLR